MIYIITNSTVKTIIDNLLSDKIKSLHIYKEKENSYYCEIEQSDEDTLINSKLRNVIIERIKYFHFMNCCDSIERFECKVDLQQDNFYIEEKYSILSSEATKLKIALRKLVNIKNIFSEFKIDTLPSQNLSIKKSSSKYQKTDVITIVQNILNEFSDFDYDYSHYVIGDIRFVTEDGKYFKLRG